MFGLLSDIALREKQPMFISIARNRALTMGLGVLATAVFVHSQRFFFSRWLDIL